MSEVEAGPDVPETDAPVTETEAAPLEDSAPQEKAEPDPVQRRINKLTWEKHEAQRREKALEERLAALEAQQKPDLKSVVTPPPTPTEFDSDAEYQQALQTHTVKTFERLQEETARAQTEQQKTTERAQRLADYRARVARFAEENDEFIETVRDAPIGDLSEAVEAVLMASPKGPELTLWLAQNPDRFAEINAQDAITVARELTKVEATFEMAAAKKASDAPPPQTELSGGDEAPTGLRDDMDIDAWMEARRAQVMERRGRY